MYRVVFALLILLASGGALSAPAAAAPAAVSIGAGFTGAWYDPSQSGHGIFVEVLPGNRLLVWWFSFDPSGARQAWFGGVGTYTGNTATITEVVQATGGRWIPNFDQTQVVNRPWGVITLTFADCSHGRVEFDSVLGYGSGGMNLTRLTAPAGLTCTPDDGPPQARYGAAAKAVTDVGWLPTGDMTAAHEGHTATLLQDGRVLVAGGYGNNATAELYDPHTRIWSATGNLNAARSSHTATLLPNGKVLVSGGLSVDEEDATRTAELYDPSAGTWTYTGSLHNARQDHTATLLQNGLVLVAGGRFQGVAGSAELYNPATGAWITTGDMVAIRFRHTATLLADGTVLAAGGSFGLDTCGAQQSTELYDPVAGLWHFAGNLNARVERHTATPLASGRVLIAGGRRTACNAQPASINRSVVFDPATGTWRESSDGFFVRYGHTASLLRNGEVLAVGGSASNSVPSDIDGAELFGSSVVCALDFDDFEVCEDVGAWRVTGSLSAPRTGHTATVLADGTVLVAGGSRGGSPVRTAEFYAAPFFIDPGLSGTWYDPAQSGHGIVVEVLPDNQLLAWWFTFNPAGTEQAWFGGVGSYSGSTATIAGVVQTTGGRWIPNFHPSQVVNNPWGTLRLELIDCNHGRAEFDSVRGYGIGSMNLTRLTLPAGLTCP